VSVEDIGRVLSAVEEHQQPDVVRVVDAIPLTDWHRPIPGTLPDDGVPRSTKARPVWYRNAATGRWSTLTASARTALLDPAAAQRRPTA
jgi:putative long chain acyl-CoA synthase